MSDLGRLERVRDIRATWPNEAQDFTPWLRDHASELSQALGLGSEDLTVQDIEVPVGAYFADMVCIDTSQPEDEIVLVENQYGRSDHDHFGKIITYASGLKAATVVLICETLREEHRTALTWLNSITNDDHKFFAIELELWKIADSPIAPRFNVVVAPDNWARIAERAKKSEASGELTELKKLYLGYWGAFREHARTMLEMIDDMPLRPRKPLPQQWTGYSIGKSGIEINCSVNTRDQWIRVELTFYGSAGKPRRDALHSDRAAIEAELGYPLEWPELDGLQQRVAVIKARVDPQSKDDWSNQHDWLYERVRDFYRVFHTRVKGLV